jgi:hypothetical protein
MDLTLLMWMIIQTLAQIMKRMLETLYRCGKIYTFSVLAPSELRSVVDAIYSFARVVYPTTHLLEFD